MSLRATLARNRAQNTSAFIPFIMAGDPDMETTARIISGLHAAGADALELGVPFSEPVADGETVQRAAARALQNGATLQGVLAMMRRLRESGVTLPVCLFSYLNPVYKMGYAAFAKEAVDAGVNGALLVDLPPEEADEYLPHARRAGLETVFLCSPTTAPERLKAIDAASSGFVYYVAREGVTGAQASLPQSVEEKLIALQDALENPVAVGFGISTRAHVEQLAGKAAGIVVGSALVKLAENGGQAAAEKILSGVATLSGGRQ